VGEEGQPLPVPSKALLVEQSVYQRALRDFHAELLAVWSRRGRPTVWALAKYSGVAPARFEFLMRCPKSAPDWVDVLLFLVAVGEVREALERWRKRWRLLVATEQAASRTRTRQSSISEPDSAQGQQVTRQALDDVDARGLLDEALEARDPVVFCAQLDKLRSLRNKSFADIAKDSKGMLARSTAHRMVCRLPARHEQVEEFVRACGVHDQLEVGDWVRAYSRAASEQRVQATVRKTAARRSVPDRAAALVDASGALEKDGAYSDAIRLLREAVEEQQARITELEAQHDEHVG